MPNSILTGALITVLEEMKWQVLSTYAGRKGISVLTLIATQPLN